MLDRPIRPQVSPGSTWPTKHAGNKAGCSIGWDSGRAPRPRARCAPGARRTFLPTRRPTASSPRCSSSRHRSRPLTSGTWRPARAWSSAAGRRACRSTWRPGSAREPATKRWALRTMRTTRSAPVETTRYARAECRAVVTCIFEEDGRPGERQGPFEGVAIEGGVLRSGQRVIARLHGNYWQSVKSRRAWPRVRIVEIPPVKEPAERPENTALGGSRGSA
jgi:hypothetical protein